MNHYDHHCIRAAAPALLALLLAAPTHAHASLFHGETLDAVANGISWVVLIIAPIIGITVFWLVHILPEKIAAQEKASADARDPVPVPALAVSSADCSGRIAWLWAYTKPVLHKLAYGTDVDESLGASRRGRPRPSETPRPHRGTRSANQGRESVMEIILLIIYSVIVWFIFFKKKWLPWNITSQVIVVTIPIFALTVIILFMNIVAPSSHDVRAMNYVVPIVPRVTGQVTEVPIEPNRPIKKGDVLFKMDPVPFEARGESRGSHARAEQGEARHRRSHAARAGGSAQERRRRKRPRSLRGSTSRRSASSNSPRSPPPAPASAPTSSRRSPTSAISKANSSPPTPPNRR